jgi:hypothetical protein
MVGCGLSASLVAISTTIRASWLGSRGRFLERSGKCQICAIARLIQRATPNPAQPFRFARSPMRETGWGAAATSAEVSHVGAESLSLRAAIDEKCLRQWANCIIAAMACGRAI